MKLSRDAGRESSRARRGRQTGRMLAALLLVLLGGCRGTPDRPDAGSAAGSAVAPGAPARPGGSGGEATASGAARTTPTPDEPAATATADALSLLGGQLGPDALPPGAEALRPGLDRAGLLALRPAASPAIPGNEIFGEVLSPPWLSATYVFAPGNGPLSEVRWSLVDPLRDRGEEIARMIGLRLNTPGVERQQGEIRDLEWPTPRGGVLALRRAPARSAPLLIWRLPPPPAPAPTPLVPDLPAAGPPLPSPATAPAPDGAPASPGSQAPPAVPASPLPPPPAAADR